MIYGQFTAVSIWCHSASAARRARTTDFHERFAEQRRTRVNAPVPFNPVLFINRIEAINQFLFWSLDKRSSTIQLLSWRYELRTPKRANARHSRFISQAKASSKYKGKNGEGSEILSPPKSDGEYFDNVVEGQGMFAHIHTYKLQGNLIRLAVIHRQTIPNTLPFLQTHPPPGVPNSRSSKRLLPK